ncbi:molybdenum cofactor guanylyltransferase [Aquimarina sp. AU474]|uniref:molybdenum cofactor guanylyltransferase n=1 Tax=Aquimarina sp. AU474 TaxID=2108529 RepID=UPI000D68826A|nr:molybdenum cofactor guanylyltransferase [Aquimarina sp. AU474]
MNLDKKVTGIILAGGKSSRMGSEKGLLLFENTSFIKHISNALQPLIDELIIVSNNPQYDKFKGRRVPDIIPDSGPIAGLHAGLLHSKTENNLVLSCDVPLITTTLLQKLLPQKKEDYDAIIFESKQQTIPLIAMYKKQCAEKCAQFLANGEKRLRKLISELNTKTITILEEEHFFVSNINTPEDLKIITNGVNH